MLKFSLKTCRYFFTLGVITFFSSPLYAADTHLPEYASDIAYGYLDVSDPKIQVPSAVKPLMNHWLRDTYVNLGSDGYYYLTGTEKQPNKPTAFEDSPGLQVWRSKDLKEWHDMGVLFDLNKIDSWQKDFHFDTEAKIKVDLNGNPIGKKRRTLWAPEIHYIKSQKNYFVVACVPENPNGKGSYILKSTTGKAEGPYVNIEGNKDGPIFDNIDGSLFEDDDGTVYFVGHNNYIAKMKADMSGLAEELKEIKQTRYEKEPYLEGAYIFKAGGKYQLIHAIWSYQLPNGQYTYNNETKGIFKGDKKAWESAKYSYDLVIATSDSPYGPYSKRYVSALGAGHNNFFQDKQGEWWATMFGNPRGTIFERPFIARPAIIPMKFEAGKFYPDPTRL